LQTRCAPSGAGVDAISTGNGWSTGGLGEVRALPAISRIPKLSALSAALSGRLNPAVNLVDTFNEGQVTVFAPVDNAFARLPPEITVSLQTDAAQLTRLLTYHEILGRFSPTNIDGTHKTLHGGDLSVAGAPDHLWVNDALVLCGGITTANATLYLIDTVLTPPA
jgi:uncharacterized surface protein with fasciclin (FAS1) repeats